MIMRSDNVVNKKLKYKAKVLLEINTYSLEINHYINSSTKQYNSMLIQNKSPGGDTEINAADCYWTVEIQNIYTISMNTQNIHKYSYSVNPSYIQCE